MCGICGFIGFKDDNLLKEMARTISHRGLDDEGYFVSGEVSLGFRRLSIIDLKSGNQPLTNEDNKIWSVCNGEIYNFKEIKEILIAKGHTFNTNTDTEILPHCYEEWGINFVSRLNGMFAFALWDKPNKKLFLVRDRLGIKPLHYTIVGKSLVFASEVKAILKFKGVNKELNFEAMDDFLTFRYIQGAVTFFKDIKILQPGHILLFEENNISLRRYWYLEMNDDVGKKSEQDYINDFNSLFEKSLKRRLLSDVPIGVYLSGGLDSSYVASFVKEFYSGKLMTFSHGYDETTDELKYARLVAKHLGAEHREVLIKEEHIRLLPKIIYHMDSPIANSDIIAFYLLARLSRDYIKVILAGEGADEIFGSYVHQEMLYCGDFIKRIIPEFMYRKVVPFILKNLPLKVVNRLFRYPGYSLDKESRLKILDYFESNNLADDYLSINSLFNLRQKNSLYSDNFKENLCDRPKSRENIKHILSGCNINNVLNRLIFLEFQSWLPNYHLIKEDKIAMSQCLEQRYPFLDHELVEFMGKVPVKYKMNGFKRKYLLRKAAKSRVPKEIYQRQKGPILVPINRCFENTFVEMLNEYLSEEQVRKRGYFNYSYIKELVDKRRSNPFLYDRQLFALLALEIWHSVFIGK